MGLSGGFHRCQGGTHNGWISGEIAVRPWGVLMTVRGEFRWPSAGSFSGRLWGLSHGRRHGGARRSWSSALRSASFVGQACDEVVVGYVQSAELERPNG